MGTFAGGLLRDLGLEFGLTSGVTYALIFFVASVGLAAAVLILRSEEILGFARETGRLDQPIDLPLGAMY